MLKLRKQRLWQAALGLITVLLAAAALDDLPLEAPSASELLIDLKPVLALVVLGGVGAFLFGRARGAEAARAVRRGAAVHRSIVDSAGEAIIVIDQSAIITLFNPAAEAMFGYAAEEVVGGSLERLMPEKAAQAHAAYLAQHGVTAMVLSGQSSTHKGLRKNGEVFPFAMNMTEWSDERARMFTGLIRDLTEAQAAEAALRRSEAQNRAIVDSAGDGIMLFDSEGRIMSFNRAAETIFGYSAEEVVGRRIGLLMTEEQGRDEAYVARYAPGAEPGVFGAVQRVERRRKNGEVFPLELTVTEWRDGSRNSYTAVMRDITERSRSEVALRESEERYGRIFAHSLTMITLFDVASDGEFTYNALNPAAERMSGFGSADLVGRRPEEVLKPKVAARTLETLQSCFRLGEPIEIEGDLRRPDGSVANLAHQVVPIRDGSGRITQMLAQSRDVTETKRASAILQESREQFEGLFTHSSDALFVVTVGTDSEVLYERVNREAEALLGLSDAEVAGRRVSDLIPAEAARLASAGYLQCVERGSIVSSEDELEIDGVRRTFQASFVPLPDAQGRITRVLASSREITDRVLAEGRLRASQKLEAIGQLAGGVAHDFNNLLLIVDGYARRAVQLIGPEGEAGLAASEILKAAERGTELVKQLLVFSRRQINEPRSVRIAAALKETQGLLTPLLGAAHPVRFWIDEGAVNLAVEIDPAELAQAVMNLATNARDAMPGGGTVQIDLEVVDLDVAAAERHGLRSGRYVELSVQDTGAGMEPDVAARIFEPFFTTKQQGKGTGLGLAMVYGFVEQSGGAITVVSAPGAGSTFRLLLPVTDQAPVVKTAEIETSALGAGETILLVEDDVQLLALLRQTVEELGYRVITAQHGAEALEVEAEHEGAIDLVLTDVVMPTLGGFEMAEILRASRPETKVLFMSGCPARGENKTVAIPSGSAFLPKPFTPAKLARSLREVLSGDPAILSHPEAA